MKKTLNGNSIETHINATESIGDYISIFDKYFHIIGHHCTSEHNYNKDALLIYSSFPVSANCGSCAQNDDHINIERIPHIHLGGAFYEESFRNIPCGRLIHILYDDHLVGIYCKKNNILCMSDIAHSPGDGPHIQKIFQELVDQKLLKVTGKVRGRNKKVTLGADPEFETKVKGRDVSAFDLLSVSSRNKTYISHDGHTQPQREMRPDPANTPQELVENIRDLIKISSFFGEDLYVTGNKMALGGHIHVGNATASPDIITAMDYFFTPFAAFNSELRKASKYGKVGDVRSKEHGFEYRTPPSAWLATPILATMVLELTKTIVEKLINCKEVVITDKFTPESYQEDLKGLGFTNEWCDKFTNELNTLKANMEIPLAKTWDCEVPQRYRVCNSYTVATKQSTSDPRITRLSAVLTPDDFPPVTIEGFLS